MEAVDRKTMLYKSRVEYMSGEGVYAMNHALGCSHGCRYPCYAYLSARRFGQVESYEDWCRPKLVGNTLELLERELAARRSEPVRRVHMCFTTDPFPYLGSDLQAKGGVEAFERAEGVHGASMAAMREINSRGIPVTVLTKGTLPWAEVRRGTPTVGDYVASAYLADPHPGNEYGISIVSLDEGFRERWEPGAAPFAERVAGLKALHDAGFRTWVSMEPWMESACYAGPAGRGTRPAGPAEAELHRVLDAIWFADRIVFGRPNHGRHGGSGTDPRADAYYLRCARTVRRFCSSTGAECVIKKGTEG